MSLNKQFRKIGLVAVSFVATLLSAEPIVPAAPQLAATAYLLMDAETGQILVAENEHEKLPPASLTKLMTSYIAEREILEGRIALTDETLVSENAWRTPGSRMFIQEGKMVSIEDLLRGIIIPSGNDASVAMAEHIAGSEDVFAQMMNTHAERLGMNNTYFANSSGLPPKNGADHYSTAYDLAILAQAIIYDNAEFYPIYSERSFKYGPVAAQPNRNRLLGTNPDVDGLKTGHTDAAGYCLVASAKRDDMRLISVVMGTRSEDARAQETQKLLTYGFRFFRTAEVHKGGEELYSSRIWGGESKEFALGLTDDLKLTIARGAEDQLSTKLNIDSVIKAPVVAGQKLGEMVVTISGEEVARRDIVALESVEKAGFFARIWDLILLFFSDLFSR
ncbi:D-alanyl-D-alanine carboxypeptidase family protein [Reinekea marinisedimentorum]|uniref:serine-type D-Ala-D-Ala carboxypeptidase n=1 Tax=Reinekea marinisedimentorum TaxID=230495 RepID=A0A4R3I6G2_9GAMM|nr:D-alanyl-D-alanine carboxypeptidase family protein [Reinekea marinisedimentorum]TCS41675.1 D-alanyl-D-alanine carboxypeptidase (penicillin-binding protein 5/6) [Reinekea marinisedimentorum]